MIAEGEGIKSDAVLRLLRSTPGPASEKLPVSTTAADIRELVQYLKRRPSGVNAAEELNRPRKRLFEDRKLEAYEFLGITTRQGQTLRLASLGWQFAQNLEQDAQVFRFLLKRHGAYTEALNWMSQQNIDMLTSTELSDFWHREHVDAFAFDEPEANKGSVVSFFSLCQAAGLGTMTLGKRGHITRLSVDRDELGRFLNEKPSLDSFNAFSTTTEDNLISKGSKIVDDCLTAKKSLTVLIKCADARLADLLHRTLETAGLPSAAIDSVADKSLKDELGIPTRENCALITVLGEESFLKTSSESTSIRDRVLIELGAAHVHYDRRVIILAAGKTDRCEALKDLIWHEIDGEHLSWEVGLQLIQTLREFRKSVQPQPAMTSKLA